ncbi:purine-nucleoside phosphorylase [Treponema phagedenis]|uniref:purine-nucleoside phosphorylase n=1 Tax=Treponema phagedenis TaxID=162 RepID=UPI0011E7A3CE|nr:purine-nucleoside phosphorylase [Treponema phagedenis]QEK00696.1 purine-nucleoside phosphorylase [Treponema phagedenis]
MSIHIGAKKGEIADRILLPGDPLRAKFVAENFFENAVCYNEVRGMLGFTGTYKGVKVSVQGTGMGLPSHSIYVTELFKDYDVQKAIRIGTAGSLRKDIPLRALVLAMAASTDSGMNTHRFEGRHYAPSANWNLLKHAYEAAQKIGAETFVGGVASSDVFYNEKETWKLWAEYGVLAVEMETAELYTLAAKYNREALSILTISDSVVTGEATSAEERQLTFKQMMETALEAIIA